MSIYGSSVVFDDTHAEDCAIWVESPSEPGIYAAFGETCTCGLRNAPIVYEGSHVLPADTDRRGGGVDVASIPGFIERDGRDQPDEDGHHPWLRLSVDNVESLEQWHGKPYVRAGRAVVVLDARHVARLHKYLGEWLGAIKTVERLTPRP